MGGAAAAGDTVAAGGAVAAGRRVPQTRLLSMGRCSGCSAIECRDSRGAWRYSALPHQRPCQVGADTMCSRTAAFCQHPHTLANCVTVGRDAG
jgi:hypothetical protein